MNSATEALTINDPINGVLQRLAGRSETALIPYFMAGFPTLDESLSLMRQAVEAGADMIEIGVPHSDPIADGPAIQRASTIALRNGFRLRNLLERLANNPLPIPVIVMSYLNPLLAYGQGHIATDFGNAGFRGLIVPDLPPDESRPWSEGARANGLSLIHLVAPNTSDRRVADIARRCDTFLYAVSISGTTGARANLPEGIVPYVTRVKSIARVPVAVGFGISTASQVRSLHGVADAVICGSRLIEAIERGEDTSAIIRELKCATRRVAS